MNPYDIPYISLIYSNPSSERPRLTVGVPSAVGHTQSTRLGVLELEVLIGELGTVDRLSAGSVTSSKVSSLEHEVGWS